MKDFKLSEENSKYYKELYNQYVKTLVEPLIDDIRGIFRKYKVNKICFKDSYDSPKIIGADNKERYFYDISTIYNKKYKVELLYFDNDGEVYVDLSTLSIDKILEIYEDLESYELEDIVAEYVRMDDIYSLGEIVSNNIKDFDLYDIEGKSVVEWYEEYPDEFEEVVKNEHFQDWYLGEDPFNISFFKDNDIELHKKIKEKYHDLDIGSDLGTI